MKSPFALFIIALAVGFEAGSRGWHVIAVLCFLLAALAGCLALALWYLGPVETTENAESTKNCTEGGR